MRYKVLDLFCGAGGLSLGFEQCGFDITYAIENNKIYAQTYKINRPNTSILLRDIREFTEKEIITMFNDKEIDVIIGGPPCQGFSLAGKIGRKFLDDERNTLFVEYLKFVKCIQPSIFVIENVASLLTHNKRKTIEEIKKSIKNLEYNMEYKVLNASDYGVPQHRRRIFIIGFNKKITKFVFPEKKKYNVSIMDAIGDLPKLKSGEKSDIDLHNAMNHTKQMLEKMSYVSDGGNRVEMPEEIRPKSGDIRKYIRYKSSEPSICITGDMRKVFHYEQNRALTCRELARIQTFPDNYKFCGNSISIQQQIGNAVPPLLAFEIAKCVKRSLEDA